MSKKKYNRTHQSKTTEGQRDELDLQETSGKKKLSVKQLRALEQERFYEEKAFKKAAEELKKQKLASKKLSARLSPEGSAVSITTTTESELLSPDRSSESPAVSNAITTTVSEPFSLDSSIEGVAVPITTAVTNSELPFLDIPPEGFAIPEAITRTFSEPLSLDSLSKDLAVSNTVTRTASEPFSRSQSPKGSIIQNSNAITHSNSRSKSTTTALQKHTTKEKRKLERDLPKSKQKHEQREMQNANALQRWSNNGGGSVAVMLPFIPEFKSEHYGAEGGHFYVYDEQHDDALNSARASVSQVRENENHTVCPSVIYLGATESETGHRLSDLGKHLLNEDGFRIIVSAHGSPVSLGTAGASVSLKPEQLAEFIAMAFEKEFDTEGSALRGKTPADLKLTFDVRSCNSATLNLDTERKDTSDGRKTYAELDPADEDDHKELTAFALEKSFAGRFFTAMHKEQGFTQVSVVGYRGYGVIEANLPHATASVCNGKTSMRKRTNTYSSSDTQYSFSPSKDGGSDSPIVTLPMHWECPVEMYWDELTFDRYEATFTLIKQEQEKLYGKHYTAEEERIIDRKALEILRYIGENQCKTWAKEERSGWTAEEHISTLELGQYLAKKSLEEGRDVITDPTQTESPDFWRNIIREKKERGKLKTSVNWIIPR